MAKRQIPDMRTFIRAGVLIVAAMAAMRDGRVQASDGPQAAVDELLAADRAFSAASAKTDLVSGLSAMFADDVMMPLPTGQFAEGKAKAIDALRGNPNNDGARTEWTPIRGGVSADGRHGFTFGHMTLYRKDGTTMPIKYVSYWVKGEDGWRVAAYKRGPAARAPDSLATLAASLPARLVPPSKDAASLAAHKRSLEEAELAFSREAQTIGLGPAFAKYGSADAVNMGGPNEPGFVVGAEAIGKAVGGDSGSSPSPLSWAPDKVIVASSGDLGVSIGIIRRNAPPKDPKQPSAFPFFTIWRRADPTAPWRYIAE
jgi:ketosteroid isomerase-like protein